MVFHRLRIKSQSRGLKDLVSSNPVTCLLAHCTLGPQFPLVLPRCCVTSFPLPGAFSAPTQSGGMVLIRHLSGEISAPKRASRTTLSGAEAGEDDSDDTFQMLSVSLFSMPISLECSVSSSYCWLPTQPSFSPLSFPIQPQPVHAPNLLRSHPRGGGWVLPSEPTPVVSFPSECLVRA